MKDIIKAVEMEEIQKFVTFPGKTGILFMVYFAGANIFSLMMPTFPDIAYEISRNSLPKKLDV